MLVVCGGSQTGLFQQPPTRGERGFGEGAGVRAFGRILAHLPSSPEPRSGVSCAPRGGEFLRLRAGTEARGGFLMESCIRERVRASVRVLHRVMPFAKTLFRARAEASPRVLHPAWAAALKDAGAGREMKIIIFSVKFDKFTGFFDKFLKSIFFVIDCNIRSCHINLSAAHSDSATKKVFRHPRICAQPPAFAHRRGFVSTRLMRGLAQHPPRERGVPFGLMSERAAGGANQLSSFSFSIRSCFTRATSALTSSMTSLPQKSFPSTTNVGMP